MEKTLRLDRNIYLNVGNDQVLPLIQAGKPLPAMWQGPFTRALSNLGAIDVHLLFGVSLVASENTSIGRWRISGIPEDDSVAGELLVKVTVSKSGNVQLEATFNDDILNVALLPGVLRKVPFERDIKTDASKVSEEGILECKNCGGPMEVRFVGKLRDKRIVCPYCGSEMDLADSFKSERQTRKQEIHDWGKRVVETTVVEIRSDSSSDGHDPGQSMNLDEVEKLVRKGSGNILDDDIVQGIIGRSLEGNLPTNTSRIILPQKEQVNAEGLENDSDPTRQMGCLVGLLQMFGIGRRELKVTYAKSPLLGDRPFKRGSLELEDLIRQKGPPPPPEELVSCPSCNAKISKDEIRCPWCSEMLALPEETSVEEDRKK